MYDLSGKWRTQATRRNGRKLTAPMVRKIRAIAASIENATQIEKIRDVQAELLLYDVSPETIKNVITRTSFAWID